MTAATRRTVARYAVAALACPLLAAAMAVVGAVAREVAR